ncbi:MAG: hypothetical protein HZA88_05740 [Verrucomicrobia bacterium]|nr:hypothetical protein [Verrucomicrobiota bacterium]
MTRLDRNANASVLLMIQLQEEIMSNQGAGNVRAPSSTVHRLRERIPQEYLVQFDQLIETGWVAVAPKAYDTCERLLPAADVWMLSQMSELPAHCPQCDCHLHHDFGRTKSKVMTGRTAKSNARYKTRR